MSSDIWRLAIYKEIKQVQRTRPYLVPLVECLHLPSLRTIPLAPGRLSKGKEFATENNHRGYYQSIIHRPDTNVSLSQLPRDHRTAAMSGTFHRFQDLPRELQLMVFEQVILATPKPRIVLIDAEEVVKFAQRFEFVGPGWVDYAAWTPVVENKEQLYAEKPTVVAWGLLGVNSASRYVATRFLHRSVEINPMVEINYLGNLVNVPYYGHLPKQLNLSVESDVFWVPDDLEEFCRIRNHRPTGSTDGEPEEDHMQSVMISLHTFEKAFQWKIDQSREDYLDVCETHRGWGSVLRTVLRYYFPRTRNLIVMVDVPRGHVSWDQIQVVGADDPTPYTLSDGDAPVRCYSALESYMALQSEYMRIIARELHQHLWLGFPQEEFDPEQRLTQPWPELSFAFRRPLFPPVLSQP